MSAYSVWGIVLGAWDKQRSLLLWSFHSSMEDKK